MITTMCLVWILESLLYSLHFSSLRHYRQVFYRIHDISGSESDRAWHFLTGCLKQIVDLNDTELNIVLQ
jgi:hypothetical protein